MCFFSVLAAKNARLDVSLPNLSTALHLAVRSGSEPLVQTLLAKGLDPNTTGPKEYTALHLAALHSHPALVEMLLKAEAQVDSEIKRNKNTMLNVLFSLCVFSSSTSGVCASWCSFYWPTVLLHYYHYKNIYIYAITAIFFCHYHNLYYRETNAATSYMLHST